MARGTPTLCALALAALGWSVAQAGASPTTAVEDAGHAGLRRWFQALSQAEAGKGVARALHYGDSTIAADGLARTVRSRLQARFGDAGPGFVSAAVNNVRVSRADVVVSHTGDWKERSILLGGASGRYGLGGTVGIALPGAVSVMKPAADAAPWRKVELWYQAGVGYGSLWASADGGELGRQDATAESTEDRRLTFDLPNGTSSLKYGAEGGPVPWYGAVLETGKPGATWEAQGVIGAGSRSFKAFSEDHLHAQMADRHPDLVVLEIGGNEAGFPVLQYGDGTAYMPIYREALDRLREAAPDASCLVVAPPDQGEVPEEGGDPVAKTSMPRLVSAQRRVAADAGCAFWSAFDAMGGSGSIVRWAALHPPLAWTDYVHLSPRGLALIGDQLADALLGAYDDWKRG